MSHFIAHRHPYCRSTAQVFLHISADWPIESIEAHQLFPIVMSEISTTTYQVKYLHRMLDVIEFHVTFI